MVGRVAECLKNKKISYILGVQNKNVCINHSSLCKTNPTVIDYLPVLDLASCSMDKVIPVRKDGSQNSLLATIFPRKILNIATCIAGEGVIQE